MFKTCVAVLFAVVLSRCDAQSLSPAQLGKLFEFYHSGRPDQAENYLYSISPLWTIDRSSITNQADYKTMSWVYYDSNNPDVFGMYIVETATQPGKSRDRVAFLTNNKSYFDRYVDVIKPKCDLTDYKKDQSNGSERSVYQLGQLCFVLTVEPTNAKRKIVYTVTIQAESSN